MRSADSESVQKRVVELQAALRAAQDESVKNSRTTADQKKKSDTEHEAALQAKDAEIATLKKDIHTVQERLVKSQEARHDPGGDVVAELCGHG